MPSNLNNAATTDGYTEVVFSFARQGFTMDISNAAIYYQLGYVFPSDRNVTWAPTETWKGPTLNSFTDTAKEGLPEGTLFGGIRVRSAVAGTPARVTVA